MAVQKFKPATKLREIRELCSPRPLVGEQLDTLFVETDAARDPEDNARQAIKSILGDSGSNKHILVYGHRGCGKSTELALLAKELGDGWLCVNFSIQNETNIFGLRAEDVLLVVAYKIVEAAKREELHSLEQDERLKKAGDWFKQVTKTTESGKEAQLELEAGVKAGSGGWLFGLGELFAKFSSDIKYRSTSQTSIVEEIRKRPADLIEQINRVVESVQDALKARNKQLLIIIEDLDKLSIADARSVFIENSNLLTGINANIICTIPIFTFHSPDANAMKAAFDREFPVQMIKVRNPDDTRANGFNVVKEIVHRRVDKSAIDEDALELLVEKTGGVLRHVFEVLQTASNMTSLREPPIQRKHIEYGLLRLKADMGTQIALPIDKKIDGLDNVKQLYDKLFERVRALREGKPSPVTGDPVIQVLLQSCALVEYNGKRWLGVHPLVTDFLKELGYDV
jgi:DNA polymerase III delta prime subunit